MSDFKVKKIRSVMSASDSKLSNSSYFDRIWENFDRTLDEVFSFGLAIPCSPTSKFGMQSVESEDGHLNISVDVPGIPEPNITIEIADRVLSVKGEHKTATSSHSVHRSMTIPTDYDTDNVVAKLKDGILSLTIPPKALPAKEVKKIVITPETK